MMRITVIFLLLLFMQGIFLPTAAFLAGDFTLPVTGIESDDLVDFEETRSCNSEGESKDSKESDSRPEIQQLISQMDEWGIVLLSRNEKLCLALHDKRLNVVIDIPTAPPEFV